MRSLLLTFTTVLAIASVRSTKLNASVCQSAKPCYCQLSESSYIDLTPIASQKLVAKTGTIVPTTYEIHLCSSFTKKSCSNVLGCQEKLVNTYAIGSSFSFINASLVELQNGAKGRLSKITLECGTGADSTLKFENESPQLTYNFKLISPHACVKTVETTTPSPATNSTTTTPHSSNSTTQTTVTTTHASNTTTASTHASNTTTPASNTTTASTHASNTTTVTTPASNTTTASTHASNTTTVTTVPTNSTTASTSPSTKPTITSTVTTKPTTTAPPTTTHKGGASTITSFNVIFLLITGIVLSKVSL